MNSAGTGWYFLWRLSSSLPSGVARLDHHTFGDKLFSQVFMILTVVILILKVSSFFPRPGLNSGPTWAGVWFLLMLCCLNRANQVLASISHLVHSLTLHLRPGTAVLCCDWQPQNSHTFCPGAQLTADLKVGLENTSYGRGKNHCAKLLWDGCVHTTAGRPGPRWNG